MQFQEVEAAVKKNKIDNVTPSSPNSIISLNKKIKKVKSTSKQLQEEVNFKNKKIFTTTDLDWIDDMMMTIMMKMTTLVMMKAKILIIMIIIIMMIQSIMKSCHLTSYWIIKHRSSKEKIK
jgi:hypothetical protein